MKGELIIINVILALTVIGATVELRRGWVEFETTHSPAGIQFDGEALGVPAGAESPARPVQDWTAIAEQNLFSFDRNDLAIETSEGPVAAGPRPFLFGTVSLGDEPMAMLASGGAGNRAFQAGADRKSDRWLGAHRDPRQVGAHSLRRCRDHRHHERPDCTDAERSETDGGPEWSCSRGFQRPGSGARSESSIGREPYPSASIGDTESGSRYRRQCPAGIHDPEDSVW